MGLFTTDSAGRFTLKVSYLKGSHIEDIIFQNLLPGQKILVEATAGEELTPFSNPEYFDFDEES